MMSPVVLPNAGNPEVPNEREPGEAIILIRTSGFPRTQKWCTFCYHAAVLKIVILFKPQVPERLRRTLQITRLGRRL